MFNMSEEVLTEELLEELRSRPQVEPFLEENQLDEVSFAQCLNNFLDEKNLERKDVIHKTSINETHAYQMFSGDRGASRNKVLQIALAMGLDLRQTNKLLHSAGVSNLYCKDRRDAIIIFCIENSYDLSKTEEKLYEFGEETLSNE